MDKERGGGKGMKEERKGKEERLREGREKRRNWKDN